MTTSLRLAAVCGGLTALFLGCRADTQPAAAPVRPQPARAKALPETNKFFEFARQRVKAEGRCFYGPAFPACDFEDPAAVRDLIGPYTITTAYYDAAGQKAATAGKPGRYAAVVEIKRADGRTSRRFLTLCQLGAGPAAPAPASWISDPAALKQLGIDQQVLTDHADELARWTARWTRRLSRRPGAQTLRESFEALMVAGLFDLTALKKAGKDLPKDKLMRLERQWWVTFKRGFYGYDKLYPAPFVCPRPIQGKPATMVHAGTAAEAGMKADAVEAIDAACRTWLKNVGIGFNLCVVRHGVIAFNRAYGKQFAGPDKDAPFTTTTAAQTASAGKFFGGILLAEFIDQGLIDPDAPVHKYVPQMRGIKVRRPVTVRDMYLHISGFAQIAGDMNPDLEEIVADMYPGVEVAVKHRYGGTGLALGGKIMENMSGESIPMLYRRHLLEPMGVGITNADGTSGGAVATALDLARIGQMMLNGGAYGDKRFLRPEAVRKMMPIPGHDRWHPPDRTCRWGIGIKQFDVDGLSEQAYGHPGASGTSLVVDPKYDLVIALTRFEEGGSFKQFLKRKAKVYKAVLDGIQEGK